MAAYPEPIPRRNLFTNGDAEAWEVQVHMLRYVMSPLQIAQIDYGIDPIIRTRGMAFSWAHGIELTFPRADAVTMIKVAFRDAGQSKRIDA